MVMTTTTLGAAAALATAFAWSVATLLFKKSGEHISPVALNYFKNVVGLALLLVTMLAAGSTLAPEAPLCDLLVLLASGAVGIALADSLFFASLNMLGAGRSAIVDCLYAPFVVLFSMAWLGEALRWQGALGGLLVVGAVLLSSAHVATLEVPRRQLWLGIAYGALAMALTAAAIVAAKPVLTRYSVLWATSVRLCGGVAALSVYALVHAPTRRVAFRAFLPQRAWRFALPGSIAGAYVALLFWVAGFKYTSAAIASILNQTSTILVVLLAALFLHERLTPIHALAAALAFIGSVLVLV